MAELVVIEANDAFTHVALRGDSTRRVFQT